MQVFAPDIGIDLGSSNTMIYVKKRKVVVAEPTLLLVSSSNRHLVRAAGDEAYALMGRTTDTLMPIRPMKNSMVDDIDSLVALAQYLMRKAIGISHLVGPKVLVSVPSSLPAVSRKALIEAITLAGAREK